MIVLFCCEWNFYHKNFIKIKIEIKIWGKKKRKFDRAGSEGVNKNKK